MTMNVLEIPEGLRAAAFRNCELKYYYDCMQENFLTKWEGVPVRDAYDYAILLR